MKLGRIPNTIFFGFLFLGLLAIGFQVALGPIHNGSHIPQAPHMQAAHAIGFALYSYANDHGGNYPTGKSSTEVFQTLIDEGYATDPGIFYLPMAGKLAPRTGQKLKPENVCWDFTSGTNIHSPMVLPLVFTTGYRVAYTPGAVAVPVIKPYPKYEVPARTWSQWWQGEPRVTDDPGIVAFYISNMATFSFLKNSAIPDSISDFIAPDYKPNGETYRQLTPDGALAP